MLNIKDGQMTQNELVNNIEKTWFSISTKHTLLTKIDAVSHNSY